MQTVVSSAKGKYSGAVMERLVKQPRMVSHLALIALRFYKHRISTHLGAHCRYDITCSAYMQLAIEKHGLSIGIARGVARLCACHPFSKRPLADAP
jgi:uncharacterized protein